MYVSSKRSEKTVGFFFTHDNIDVLLMHAICRVKAQHEEWKLTFFSQSIQYFLTWVCLTAAFIPKIGQWWRQQAYKAYYTITMTRQDTLDDDVIKLMYTQGVGLEGVERAGSGEWAVWWCHKVYIYLKTYPCTNLCLHTM